MKFEKEEVANLAAEFVNDVFKKAGLDLSASAQVADGCVEIDVSGSDADLVLADNARVLYSVNHLVNQIFYRQSKDGYNFFLDCNEYRAEREAELELMAVKAAEKACSSGLRVSLQPMPSSERRIIHLALAEDQTVRTESQGTGRYRRVLIVPESA